MPIRFNKDFLLKFAKKDLKKIKRDRKIAIVLSLLALILHIYVYIAVTYLGFVYWGPEGYIYDYYVRRELILYSYYLSWIAIMIAVFCIYLHKYLFSLTINPHIEILKARKNENPEILESQIKEYKQEVKKRLIFQLLIILVIIVELNYYPRNTQLFYPYISCDTDTGICVITNEALMPFIIVMTSFLLILFILYAPIIFINLKEVSFIRHLLNPTYIEKEEDSKRREYIPIEERRELKLKKIRNEYQTKYEAKQEQRKEIFMNMLEKEQYGSTGFKKNQKNKKTKTKLTSKPKKKKDEFDFT